MAPVLLGRDLERTLAMLRHHAVALPLVEAVKHRGIVISEPLKTALEVDLRDAVVRTMKQERALQAFAKAIGDLPFVVWKGAHLGRVVYRDAVYRCAVDVDVLIHERDRERALACLGRAGFSAVARARKLSHEVALHHHGAWIDLHWQIVRPGRTRGSLTPWVLERRLVEAGLWVPDDTATLVLLLVHTAFADHVTGRLIRALDVDRWVRQRAVDWDEVLTVLTRARARTAAFATLDWTMRMFATPVPPGVIESLAPRPARRRYLRAWLARDPGNLYLERPRLVRLAFSLALADGPFSLLRTVLGRVQSSRVGRREYARLGAIIGTETPRQ